MKEAEREIGREKEKARGVWANGERKRERVKRK